MKLDTTEAGILALGATLGAAAFLGLPAWIVQLLQHALCTGLAALMLLLLWRSGLVSFGHALYFGGGAYSVVLANQWMRTADVVVVLPFAILVCGACGYFVGFIVRRYRGIFFAMLNLALSMVLYGAIVKSSALGSTDGFSVASATFFGWRPESPQTASRILFLLTVVIVLAAAGGLHRYLRTAMGTVTTAVRDNEIRLAYLGFGPEQAIHVNYTASAAVTGLAGALLALMVGQVDPDSMVGWTVSGELVFITVLGGIGSVAAPLVGALVFEVLRLYAFEIAPAAWRLVMGGVLLGLILFRPEGLWSLLVACWNRAGRAPREEVRT